MRRIEGAPEEPAASIRSLPVLAQPSRQPMRLLALALLAATIGGCAHMPSPLAQAHRCAAGERAMLRDTLYLGRNRPDGGPVSDAQWQGFVRDAITPRFPQGFTVSAASGQWRGADGHVQAETTQVLTVLHADDAAANASADAVADEYKRRFGQEAVLRERSRACVRF